MSADEHDDRQAGTELPYAPLADKPEAIPSTVSVLQHPIHPMLVVYPICLLTLLPVTDLVYWHTRDAFWAVASFWMLAVAFVAALLAACAGFADFVTMRLVRRHVSSWNHFLCGVLVISLAGANLLLRLADPIAGALPWGLLLSLLILPLVAVTGWLGGTLTFRHSIGTFHKSIDDPPRARRASLRGRNDAGG